MSTQQTGDNVSNTALLEGLRAHLQPLAGDARQYNGLLALIGRTAPMSSIASGQRSPSA